MNLTTSNAVRGVESLHAHTWRQLQIRRAQLPHALLLTGQSGIGKFWLAKAFASGLLCETPLAEGVACGSCQACHWLSQGNHPDFRLVIPEYLQKTLASGETEEPQEASKGEGAKAEKKASQQITIEQIRQLDSFLSVGTHRQGLRVILIYPAEAMNRNTANSILKSLEEPPVSTLFLLVSSNGESLLPTIRSRCQMVPISTPSEEQALPFVMANGSFNTQLAQSALALSGGAPLQAIDLAERLTGSWFEQLFSGLAKGGQLDGLALAADLDKSFRDAKEPFALRQTLDWLQKWVFDLSLLSAQQPVVFFRSYQDVLRRLEPSVSSEQLVHFYRHLLLPMRKIADHPVNLRLHLESLLSQYQFLFARA